MNLDEKLETVTKGMKAVQESVEPLSRAALTPTLVQNGGSDERSLLLRKHGTLVAEWESVQDESDVLREELKEDKWLTVFRTVTEQADGMMSSLEKAVNRCQVSLVLIAIVAMLLRLCRTSFGKSIDVGLMNCCLRQQALIKLTILL
jgi:hypothetical protein